MGWCLQVQTAVVCLKHYTRDCESDALCKPFASWCSGTYVDGLNKKCPPMKSAHYAHVCTVGWCTILTESPRLPAVE